MMHGHEKSDPAIVAVKPANKAEPPAAEQSAAKPTAAEPVEPRARTKGNADQQSTCRTQCRASVSQALERIRKVARERKQEKFTALFHHISIELLEDAFFELKENAAPGVDRLTWQDYEADLERNLTDLHDRVHRGAYRALPSRRVYIPKADGRQRPIAVAAIEDKIVQRAVTALLNAIYEEDFLGFSYGFRPGRGAHDAMDALCVGIHSKKVSWILDADIRSFFDEISQERLIRLLKGPDWRSTHHPPDPEVAEGGRPRRRGRDGEREGDGARIGDLTAACQHLPALHPRPLGRAPTARAHGRHDHRAICRRFHHRLPTRA